jgi:sporulation protein YlmC with PRC-barrel domain
MLLSDLLEAEVIRENDEPLGHVHDVRVRALGRRSPEGNQLRVVGLVVGGRGIRARLGLDAGRRGEPIADRELIDWDHVVAVDGERGRVTVRAGA